jgi:hypothetical protein
MKALIFTPARAVDAPPVQVQLHQSAKRVRKNDAKSVDEERCKLEKIFCSQYEDVFTVSRLIQLVENIPGAKSTYEEIF